MEAHLLLVAMALTQEEIEEGMEEPEASELGLTCQEMTGQNNLIKMLGYVNKTAI
jgi:hypothetical protein